MTIAGWIFFGVLVSCYLFFAFAVSCLHDGDRKVIVISLLAAAVATFFTYNAFHWYYTSTEGGRRAFKTQESNLNKGINRTVEVYDATGNLLKTYEGKFDVDYDDDRIIFDDENNKRHVIYYPTGTVIIDEN